MCRGTPREPPHKTWKKVKSERKNADGGQIKKREDNSTNLSGEKKKTTDCERERGEGLGPVRIQSGNNDPALTENRRGGLGLGEGGEGVGFLIG